MNDPNYIDTSVILKTINEAATNIGKDGYVEGIRELLQYMDEYKERQKKDQRLPNDLWSGKETIIGNKRVRGGWEGGPNGRSIVEIEGRGKLRPKKSKGHIIVSHLEAVTYTRPIIEKIQEEFRKSNSREIVVNKIKKRGDRFESKE